MLERWEWPVFWVVVGGLLLLGAFVVGLVAVWTPDHDVQGRLAGTAVILGLPGLVITLAGSLTI